MSFEGYYQILCRNGHECGCDCYDQPVFEVREKSSGSQEYDPWFDFEESVWKCPVCGELAAWWNLVDVTNGSYCECNEQLKERSEGCEHCDRGRIDGYVDLEDDVPVETCTCKECGSVHVVTAGTKKIPTDKGHRVG